MNDYSAWSIQVGHWRRVNVRIHALLLAVGIFALFLSTSQPGEEQGWYGLLGVAVLFASVLAHEWGHHFAATRLGGGGDQLVIGPLGGLAPMDAPREPQSELIVALAGPLVNLSILMLVLPVMVATHINMISLLSPLEPTGLVEGPWWAVLVKFTFWMNWSLLIVNLLPAYPLDGARILRAMLWPAFDYRNALSVSLRATKFVAVGACLLAWFMREPQPAEQIPAWVPLLLFAVYVYFGAQHEAQRARQEESEWDEDLLNYDFSQGYTSLERTFEAPRRRGTSVRRWLESRRELRRQRQQTQEIEEERQVDEILMRLHQSGMSGLSQKERALLDRVSARYRNRQGS